QPPVVVERAEVDRVRRLVQPPWTAARGEQDALELVVLARVVGRPARVEVERDDAAPERQVDAELLGAAPDRAFVLALPERLRERRTAVGRVTLGADQADRALAVVVADPAAGGVGGHPAADDQVPVRGHVSLLCQSNSSTTLHDASPSKQSQI